MKTEEKEQPSQVIDDGFATVVQGAKFLAVGRSKVYQLMDSGLLPHAKFGRSRRIPWRSLKQFASDSMTVAC